MPKRDTLRTTELHIVENPEDFKAKLLIWSQQYAEVTYLDSNGHSDKYSSYDCILAVDAFTSIQTDWHNAFEDFQNYRSANGDWMFGYFTYDLKNDTESLASDNADGVDFPDLFFFQPKKLFLLKGNNLEIQYLRLCDDEIESDLSAILSTNIQHPAEKSDRASIIQRIPKDAYLRKCHEMKQHIQLGDIYEANLCMEFYSDDATIDPYSIFRKLNDISKPPFAALFRNRSQYALCASPERFLKKDGPRLISQPIKGTAPRDADAAVDKANASALQSDPKERAENIMIVDLVRNDLSRTAQKGSVQVSELCEIYSFEQVHQMISTIESLADPQYTIADLIKTAFPMGSMTGAPKISAMNIIEKLEESRRGLYSGSIGYITPDGDFDFNVVIRSILYNSSVNYVSFHVGSAITSLSDPEAEYEECLLKAKAMFTVLS